MKKSKRNFLKINICIMLSFLSFNSFNFINKRDKIWILNKKDN